MLRTSGTGVGNKNLEFVTRVRGPTRRRIDGMLPASRTAAAAALLLGVFGDSAAAFQGSRLSPSMAATPPAVSRRQAVGALGFGAFSLVPALANADSEKPLVPAGEMIKPPANSCAQGVGGKCEELAEGNPLILELQKKSAENRLKYQKQELESYWNRNYKEFFDSACTAKDTKVLTHAPHPHCLPLPVCPPRAGSRWRAHTLAHTSPSTLLGLQCGFEQTADGKWRVTDKKVRTSGQARLRRRDAERERGGSRERERSERARACSAQGKERAEGRFTGIYMHACMHACIRILSLSLSPHTHTHTHTHSLAE